MEYIKSAKWAYVFVSAALVILGVCLAVWPDTSMQTICIIAGIITAVFGAIKLIGYFSCDRYGLAFQFDLALGIFAMAAGTLMCFHPNNIIVALPVIFGVFILIDGALKLQTAVDAKKFGLERWWVILILALLTCLCGAVLLWKPFDGARALAIVLGVTLIVDGIQNLGVVIYTVKTVKKTDNVL